MVNYSPHVDPWCSGQTCGPVKAEIAGSNPVGSARKSKFFIKTPCVGVFAFPCLPHTCFIMTKLAFIGLPMLDYSDHFDSEGPQLHRHWLDSTFSVSISPYAAQIKGILDAALSAVDPYRAIQRTARLDGSELVIAGQVYNLDEFQRVVVLAVGKAAFPMAVAMADILGERLETGIVVTKDGYAAPASGKGRQNLLRLRVFESGHPIPDARGVAAAQEISRLLQSLGKDDLVIFLISGGGSALLNSPVSGISLTDLQQFTALLLRSGATVNQLNTLRKHLDQVKGGGLARLASPAMMVTLILSDVLGDPLDMIASGPTVADASTFLDAWSVIEQFNLATITPASIYSYLDRGRRAEVPETLKPGNPVFERTQQVIVASNYQAASAAARQAGESGLNSLLLTSFLQGEAREVGQMMAALARQVQATGEPVKRPACMIAGGETTVTVRGAGKGGRNQELALGSLPGLAGLSQVMLVALATDGSDGPTDAAGAVVTGESLERAQIMGLEPQKFLDRNDAYPFFESLDDLLRSGPTQTNVDDLTILFAF
jgi:glycerate 2-kinase